MNRSQLVSEQTSQSDAHSLLDQAAAALQLLSKQAELARVEAKKLELEAAVNLARQGETQPLRHWLQSNPVSIAIDAMSPEGGVVHPTVDLASLNKDSGPSSSASLSGWESIRRKSLERLESIAPSIPSDSSVARAGLASIEGESKANEAAFAGDDAVAKCANPKSRLLPNGYTASPPPSTERQLDVLQSATDERIKSKLLSAADSAIAITPQVASIEPAQQTDRNKGRRARGMLISAVLHILLLIALGVVTVSVPLDQSIFQLQASEATEVSLDNLEFTSEVTTELPSEQFEAAASQPDFENALTDVGQTVSQSLSELSPESHSVGSMAEGLSATASQQPANLAASFYGASATGNCFCFLIDGSATMRGSPWEAARAELLKTLNSLSAKQRFYVIFYNQVISQVPDRETGRPAKAPLYATRENLQHATRWLQSLRVDVSIPGGNHSTVLQAALDLEPDAIFLLTDAEMTPKVEQNLLEMLRKSNRATDLIEGEMVRTPIHTIAFHSLKGVALMKTIAEENRGQSTYIPKPQ